MKYRISVAREFVIDVETATSIPVGESGYMGDDDTIYAVAVAEDNYPIIEW